MAQTHSTPSSKHLCIEDLDVAQLPLLQAAASADGGPSTPPNWGCGQPEMVGICWDDGDDHHFGCVYIYACIYNTIIYIYIVAAADRDQPVSFGPADANHSCFTSLFHIFAFIGWFGLAMAALTYCY